MIDGDDIRVLEYNARFGDPETQAVLPRMTSDLFDVFEAVIDGKLTPAMVRFSDEACVCVVAASGGYPQSYKKGLPITIGDVGDAIVFHAGTAMSADALVTSGGRVLGVTALGASLEAAREKAYKAIEKVEFEGMFYRHDICKL
jgi:phosphoribosylamine--glycine ligase